MFHNLSTTDISTIDDDLAFGSARRFTFAYSRSLLFPSFYCDKKELLSFARNSCQEVRITKIEFSALVGFLACWIPVME